MIPHIIRTKIVNDKFDRDVLLLGQVGENLATRIEIDASEWQVTGGEYALVIRRGDNEIYPVSITSADQLITWDVLAVDVGVPGHGVAELCYTNGDICAKTVFCPTYVSGCLDKGNVPATATTWSEDVLKAVDSAVDATAKVTGSISAVQEAAATSQTSAQIAVGAKTAAESSAQAAEQTATQLDAVVQAAAAATGTATEAAGKAAEIANALELMTVEATMLEAGSMPTAVLADRDGHKHIEFGLVQGADGISPSVIATAEKNNGVTTVTIDIDGVETSATIADGAKGDAGRDGVSPSARVVKADGVATITITDSGGKTTAEIIDCADEMAELKGLLAINTEFLAMLTASGAGAHNAVYRGKNLGTYVTDAQYAAIAAGTFDDLYIGDYWVIGGATYRIVAFDYYYGTGDIACTAHHITLVPDTSMYSHAMNDTNTTTGGYVGSTMYTTGLTQAKETINTAFGTAHILTHRQFLTNAVTNGRPSAGSWYDSTVELMTEQNAYGGKVFAPVSDGSSVPILQTIDKSQYPLFTFRPDMISNRQSFRFRDVTSASSFAFVSYDGCALFGTTSGELGVRPSFSIIG